MTRIQNQSPGSPKAGTSLVVANADAETKLSVNETSSAEPQKERFLTCRRRSGRHGSPHPGQCTRLFVRH